MKIKVDKTTIIRTGETLKNTFKKVKSEVQDYAKETYKTLKDKTEMVIQEIELNIPTKLERLKNNANYLELKHYTKFMDLKNAEKLQKEDPFTVYKRQKDFELITKRLQKATAEYNNFAAKQKAAQEAFDRLNNFSSGK